MTVDSNGPGALRRPRNNHSVPSGPMALGPEQESKVMSSNQTHTHVLEDAGKIMDTWTANPDFKLGEVDLATFTKERDKPATDHATVETKRTELTGLVNALHDQTKAVHDLVVRARKGFSATYGPDSTQ
jgi:hypothetical protein